MMSKTTHTEKALQYIDEILRLNGVSDYRFCIENDCYVCTPKGEFYSVCRRQMSRKGNLIEEYRLQKLKGSVDKYGYRVYRMRVNEVKKHVKGHRLVLNAWAEAHDNLCVNHKDGNKQNNSLENLEWCTVAENNEHAIRTGLHNPYKAKQFKYAVNPSEWMSIYILYKHCGYSYSSLGRMNGCVHETIKRIILRIDSIMPKEELYE